MNPNYEKITFSTLKHWDLKVRGNQASFIRKFFPNNPKIESVISIHFGFESIRIRVITTFGRHAIASFSMTEFLKWENGL